MRTFILTATAIHLGAFVPGSAVAHSGGLDANGCHYEAGNRHYHCHRAVAPNPDANAPVKKSRENLCHGTGSPNYSTLKYFIGYPTMAECVKSGGRKAGTG